MKLLEKILVVIDLLFWFGLVFFIWNLDFVHFTGALLCAIFYGAVKSARDHEKYLKYESKLEKAREATL